MPQRFKRNPFRANKFQKPIVNLVIGLAFVMLAMMVACIAFLLYDVAGVVYNPERILGTIKTIIILSLMILPLVLLAGVYWTYDISNKLIGPFERIISELDQVISNKKKGHIRARKGDQLAEEVLKRINALIDRSS